MAIKAKVSTTKKKPNIKMGNLPDRFKKRIGAAWEKTAKKGKKNKFLSIQIEGEHYFGFLNLNQISEKSPKYWLNQFGVDGKTIKCGAIWPGVSKDQKTSLLWIQLNDWRYVAMPNPWRDKGENQPKYLIYLAYSDKNQENLKKENQSQKRLPIKKAVKKKRK